MKQPDYLIIGHVALDQAPEGPRLGGTLAYAGLTAAALGRQVAALTSADPSTPLQALEPLELRLIEAPQSTAFEASFAGDKRQLRLVSRATDLDAEQLLDEWGLPEIVHLAPIADEVDPQLARHFHGAFILLTPQGWLRRWDAAGAVSRKPWLDVQAMLPAADLVVVSEEDIGFDERWTGRLAELYRLLVITRGRAGASILVDGVRSDVPATATPESDPTGAGDIFAAAFAIHYLNHRRPLAAAEFATRLAVHSIGASGLAGVPGAALIAELEQQPA